MGDRAEVLIAVEEVVHMEDLQTVSPEDTAVAIPVAAADRMPAPTAGSAATGA